MTIWRKLVILGILGSAGVPMARAQRGKDPYLSEKVQEIDKHLDSSDINEKEDRAAIAALKEQIEAYKDYALGFCGCFTLLVATLKFLGRKEEQSG